MTIPANTRLDNAALIYPPCKSSKYASGFRICVTLSEDIDRGILQKALETLMVRFPSFTYTIGKNFFWWYLKRMDKTPKVVDSRPMGYFDYVRNDGFLFRVGCEGAKIDLDIFHALTDGTGAMTFLMSLVAEYITQRYGVESPSGRWVLSPFDEPDEEEFEDSFDHFSGEKGMLDKEERAFALSGRTRHFDSVGRTRICLSATNVKSAADKYGCTVTEFITALMLYTLQDIRFSRRKPGSPYLRVEVPVNLRPIYQRKTLRNFSSYLHLGIDVRNGKIPFGEIAQDVHLQKKLFIQPRYLTTRIAANVALEDSKLITITPRFIKKPIMRLIYHIKGDKYCSTTLSNIGEIVLPKETAKHVRDIDFILGRPLRRGVVCGCATFGDKMVLNFTSRIENDDFEYLFYQNLYSFL